MSALIERKPLETALEKLNNAKLDNAKRRYAEKIAKSREVFMDKIIGKIRSEYGVGKHELWGNFSKQEIVALLANTHNKLRRAENIKLAFYLIPLVGWTWMLVDSLTEDCLPIRLNEKRMLRAGMSPEQCFKSFAGLI